MLKVDALSYCYQQSNAQMQTLCFSFTLCKGSITAILGPSGAGKSTLLSLICGLLKPTAGSIEFENNNFTNMSAHLRPLSILFQEHNLFEHLSVFDNIALGITPDLRLNVEQKNHLMTAAKNVGLEALINRLPCELSGGQKQRVALARCLVRQRPLLLLDEPFSALDPSLRSEMLQQIKTLANQNKTTILMITHHPSDAKAIADSVLFIDKGKVAHHAPISTLDEPCEKIKKFIC